MRNHLPSLRDKKCKPDNPFEVFPSGYMSQGGECRSALQGGDPQVGHFMTSLMVVDEAPVFGGNVSTRTGVRNIRPGFEGRFWSEAEVRETCFRANQFGPSP